MHQASGYSSTEVTYYSPNAVFLITFGLNLYFIYAIG